MFLLFLFTLLAWRRLSWVARMCGMLPVPGLFLLLGVMRLKESWEHHRASSVLLEYQVRRKDGRSPEKPLSIMVHDDTGGMGQTLDSVQSSASGSIYESSLEPSRERFITIDDHAQGSEREIIRRYDLRIPRVPGEQDWSSWSDGVLIGKSTWEETGSTSASLTVYQVRYRVVKRTEFE